MNSTIKNADSTKTLKVWDPLVRSFHWTLVLAFFTAYLSGDNFMIIHTWAGYIIFSLICVRLMWGLVGTHHAKFKNFFYRPSVVIDYLKSLPKALFSKKQPDHYAGHNPAGAMMIFVLLFSLITTTVSGAMLYGVTDGMGPLSTWAINASSWQGNILEGIHEFFATFSISLVAFHVGGVVVSSLLHKENLIRSMVTGRKKNNPDYVDRPASLNK